MVSTRHQAPSTREKGFKGLLAWQAAHRLAGAVYSTLRPIRQMDPWLVSQATRSAISVPANIAEGYGRGSYGDYLRFLDIARGSLSELEYYLLFFDTQGLLTEDQLVPLCDLREETGRLLTGLWKATKSRTKTDWAHDGLYPVAEAETQTKI